MLLYKPTLHLILSARAEQEKVQWKATRMTKDETLYVEALPPLKRRLLNRDLSDIHMAT